MKDALILYFTEQGLDSSKSLNDQDWKNMAELTTILRPMYLFTLELSAEKTATLSKIIPMTNLLLQAYAAKHGDSKLSKECKQWILEMVHKQFEGIEASETYAVATLMDPRFKNLAFSNKPNQAINQAKSIALSIAHDIHSKDDKIAEVITEDDIDESTESSNTKVQDEFDNLWSAFDCKVAKNPGKRSRVKDHYKEIIDLEMKKYISVPKLDRKECPIKWWKTTGSKNYPSLFEVAKKFVPMPATSVPAERAFSDASNVLTKRRNKLGKENANMLITLHTNLKK